MGRQNSYSHRFDVLFLPIDALFQVDQYFGLFHEIGHIVTLHLKSAKNPELSEDEAEVRLMKEIFADLFDFQCGFLGDYELYMDTIQSYLASIVRKQYDEREILSYAARLLCIATYELLCKDQLDKINQVALTCLTSFLGRLNLQKEHANTLIEKAMAYYAKCKKGIEREADNFRLLFDKHLLQTFHRQRLAEFQGATFHDQFAALLRGEVASNIRYPQLVILRMLTSKKDLTFKSHAAAIRSFANIYYERYGIHKTHTFYYSISSTITSTVARVIDILDGSDSIEDARAKLDSLSLPEPLIDIAWSDYDGQIESEITNRVSHLSSASDSRVRKIAQGLSADVLGHATYEGIKYIIEHVMKGLS